MSGDGKIKTSGEKKSSSRGRGPNQQQRYLKPIKTSGVLKNVTYKKFTAVGRALHIDNAMECYKTQKMLVYGLNPGDRTFLLKEKSVRVVWFKIDQDPSKHEWYGNVCYVIDFKKLVEHFGGFENLYYIEEIEFASKCYSRVLLTKKDEKHLPKSAVKMDLKTHGSPIIQNSDGTLSYASGCKRTDGRMSKRHGIEFMVDANVRDQIWLYKNCASKAVNHSECNRTTGSDHLGFEAGKCRKFNTQNYTCPYPYDEFQTENILLKHPGMLKTEIMDKDERKDKTEISDIIELMDIQLSIMN